jgi:hypothetical protein
VPIITFARQVKGAGGARRSALRRTTANSVTRTKSSRLDNLTGDLSRVIRQKNPTEIGEAFLFNVKIEGMMVIPREVIADFVEGNPSMQDGELKRKHSNSVMRKHLVKHGNILLKQE